MNAKWKAVWLSLIFSALWSINSFAETVADLQKTEPSVATITLGQVIARVLLHNPELKVFSLEKRAREARVLQSGLLPNPRLEVEVEDAVGSGNFSGFTQTQTTIQLSQLIELGGKRAARIRASSLSKELANWDYEARRIDVLTRASKFYTELLKSQKHAALSEELVQLAQQTLTTISERVKAGKVSPIEETKARVAFSSTRIEFERARMKLDTARGNLVATWGESAPQFESALGDLESVSSIPPIGALADKLSGNPDLARWATELSQRQAVVDLEHSKALPNVTFQAGYRRLEETNDNAFVFGISIPLQFFDRNQGTIAEARHRLAIAEAEKRVVETRLKNELARAHQALTLAYSEVISLKSQVVPGAQSAFDAITEGYRFGKFGYLDVLDSQRTLFQARIQYLQSLADYHKAVADLERLVGTSLIHNPPAAGEEGKTNP